MGDIEFLKLVVILIIAYLAMKMAGFAVRVITKVLIFIGVLYLIFQYLKAHS